MSSSTTGATAGATAGATTGAAPGALLRGWRRRRNLSQLELAHRAGVSTRHVSFIETGRSRPTSGMILRLCDQLGVPLREQNRLLLAGGFAPAHPEHDLADPPMAEVSAAIEGILSAHLPFPALVVDPACATSTTAPGTRGCGHCSTSSRSRPTWRPAPTGRRPGSSYRCDCGRGMWS